MQSRQRHSLSPQSRMTRRYFVIYAFISCACSFIHPVTPTFLKELAMPNYMFGVTFAAAMAASFCLSPFVGRLGGFFSSKNVLAVGCVGYACMQFLFSQATTEAGIIVTRFLSGCMYVTMQVCPLTYIINVSSPETRGRNLAVKAAIASAFGAAGYFIGGLLGEISVMTAFIAQISCMCLAGALVFFLFDTDLPADAVRPAAGELVRLANPFSSFKQCGSFLSKSVIIMFAALILAGISGNAFDQCFNYYLKDVLGLTSSYNGTIRAVTGLLALVLNTTLCVWLMRNTDIKKTSVTVMSLSSLCLLALLLITAPLPFIIMYIVYVTVNSVNNPLTQNIVAENAGAGSSNLLMGFYSSVNSLAMVVGSLVAGFMYDIEPHIPFVFSFAIAVLAVLFMAWYRRESGKSAAQTK
ncbi:MAG: MFS transporter [Clostridia bacterium]|nr:MFS transporter [Clostridia bacterium]